MAHIIQISVSQGGIPKLPVSAAMVTEAGVEGDRQANLKFHGGPDRAVCLWSAEVIEVLRQEGHPIAPGNAGENVTLEGLSWEILGPGDRLQLGTDLRIEITAYADPCRKNMAWFSDRRYRRISQQHYPGSSRLYARVIQPGEIRVGDGVIVLASA